MNLCRIVSLAAAMPLLSAAATPQANAQTASVIAQWTEAASPKLHQVYTITVSQGIFTMVNVSSGKLRNFPRIVRTGLPSWERRLR